MELKAVDYSAPNADVKFVRSLRETGFGVLSNHPVDQSLVSKIYAHWAEFFASSDKYNYSFNRDNQDGFFSLEHAETAKNFRKRDLKEYFHFYPWGQCPEHLRAELLSYYRAAHKFAAELLGWVEAHSPPEVSRNFHEPLSGMIDGSEQTLLRILNYPPITGDEDLDSVRAAAHEDINLLTILPAASVTGLQVLGSEGQWIEVPTDFSNIIVNSGDMLQEATGGYFKSTKHRVMNPVGDARHEARMSLPLFLHPRADVRLSARHTAGSYLSERLTELGVV